MSAETAVAIIFVSIIYLFMKIGVNLDEEKHAALKLLFILITIWLGVGGLGLAKNLAITDTLTFSDGSLNILDGLYNATMIIAVVVSMYFVIYYIYTVFGLFGGLVNKRKGGQR